MREAAGVVGVDTGGTFTDVVDEFGRIAKVSSTPAEPTRAVTQALARTGRPACVMHGTTVATNALLEGRGAPVALVTTRGCADVIEIARQTRPSLYDLWRDRPVPLVPRELRIEVGGRLDATGREIEPFDPATVPHLPDAVTAAAVCLLHADLNPEHEAAVARVLRARGLDVTCSHEVSPEFREYERTVTTVANASLRPLCRSYFQGLAGLAEVVFVMSSAGGLLTTSEAADVPAALLLSGPAGGVRAAAAVALACGFPDAVSFDMGGTSTDVCCIRGGMPEPAPMLVVGGYPIRLPAVDVHTIGAGGGSIARLDPGGALVVGPQSAGADPGPACYGRGGDAATVTDADLVAGRIDPNASLGDLGRLDVEAARGALARAGVTAEGVLAVVDAAMEEAVRHVTVARGVDPRACALVAFGGAGPLHACAIADALGMRAVVVPPRAGVLSAVGLMCAPRQRKLVRSWPTPHDRTGLDRARARLAQEAAALVGADGDTQVTTALDCRYAGQSHELTVPDVDSFHDEHARRNGFARRDQPVEVVAVRARASRPGSLAIEALPRVERACVTGPEVVAEMDCSVWVPPGWVAHPGPLGAWIIERRS